MTNDWHFQTSLKANTSILSLYQNVFKQMEMTMKSKLDVKNFGYAVESLDPKVMEKLATMMIELTPEDIEKLNNLKERLTLEANDEL